MALYDDIEGALTEIIAHYKNATKDGKLSFSELITLGSNAVASLMQVAEHFGGTGTEKKQAVITALGQFYDQVIAPIDIKGVPNLLEGIVDKALKELMLTLAGGWIDSLTTIFNKSGWATPTTPAPGAPAPSTPLPPGFTPY
jgi:hypothetical protein